MTTAKIPKYIQDIYTYFGIPVQDWPDHFTQDRHVRNGVRSEVAQVYQLLHKELKDARRIR
jgi:hypothetical protein